MVDSPDHSNANIESSISDIMSQEFRPYFYTDSLTINAGGQDMVEGTILSEYHVYFLREFRITQLAGEAFYAYLYHNTTGMGYIYGEGDYWHQFERPAFLYYTYGDAFKINVFNPTAGQLVYKTMIRYDAYPMPDGWILRPDAAASVSDETPVVGQTITFYDDSLNDPTSWHWDFGDGSTSELQNPTHAYASAGDYTVTLIVRNKAGYDIFSAGLTVT